jgi:hypothetical protein
LAAVTLEEDEAKVTGEIDEFDEFEESLENSDVEGVCEVVRIDTLDGGLEVTEVVGAKLEFSPIDREDVSIYALSSIVLTLLSIDSNVRFKMFSSVFFASS